MGPCYQVERLSLVEQAYLMLPWVNIGPQVGYPGFWSKGILALDTGTEVGHPSFPRSASC